VQSQFITERADEKPQRNSSSHSLCPRILSAAQRSHSLMGSGRKCLFREGGGEDGISQYVCGRRYLSCQQQHTVYVTQPSSTATFRFASFRA
jgi:hypothetical protein